MNELQQSPPQLHKDLLYAIAEKMLESIPNGPHQIIDFRRQNCYTNFMFLNGMTTWTIISQFARFKRIRFSKLGEEKIEFYNNDNFNDLQPEEFRGPYIVPKGMLEYLIENGKLRVNTIEINNFILYNHSIDIKELGEMNSFKAFCALFLGKQIQIPDGLNNNLMVKKFRVDELAINIQNNLKTILAIDAVELEIFHRYRGNTLIDCSQLKSPIIAKNTTKITTKGQFNFETSKEEVEKFATNFEFSSFLLRVCPNLNNLHIIYYSSLGIYSSIGVFIQNLHSTIKAMEAVIKSINIGNEHLQISIKLIADVPPNIYDGLPMQSHDLFKLGTPFTVECADRYIARSMEFVDVRGRIHKLQFKISEEIISDDEDYDYYDYAVY